MSAISSAVSTSFAPGLAWPPARKAAPADPGAQPPAVAKPDQAAIDAARQALAAANNAVDTDKRNHSPACVACDQKKVDLAQQQLAAAQAKASPGSILDITA